MDINELQKQAVDGSRAAEEHLFRNLHDKFAQILQHRISDHETRQDVIQDTLTTIAEKHKSIDFTVSFASWAHRVLENKVLQYYRSAGVERARHTRMESVEHQVTAADVHPQRRLTFLTCLRKVVGVNRRFGRILSLHYQGYSMDQICEKMSISKNAAYNLLSRGRRTLRECLKERRGDL